MKPIQTMKMQIESRSVNESFARAAVSAFASQLDPNVQELSDLRTAVSEAVTNCIVHAYRNTLGVIYITASVYPDGMFSVKIRDKGCGIADIPRAMEPLYTTLGGERAGLGFAVMESFTDKVRVRSVVGKGTAVTLFKRMHGKQYDGQ